MGAGARGVSRLVFSAANHSIRIFSQWIGLVRYRQEGLVRIWGDPEPEAWDKTVIKRAIVKQGPDGKKALTFASILRVDWV